MSSWASPFRARDSDVLRAEMRYLAAERCVPVLFAGEVRDGEMVLTEHVGVRTAALRGLLIRPKAGLGGASMVAGRPLSVADYRRSSSITHDYDAPVVVEGIRSVLAVPVMVNRTARAVLYGASRGGGPIAGRAAEMMVDAAGRLATELRVRDEVDARLAMQAAVAANSATSTADPEQIRAVYAELRQLAAATAPVSKHRLKQVAESLLRAVSDDHLDEAHHDAPRIALSPREIDVLTLVSLGCTNQQAAEHLSLRTQTVKGYLRNASAKLGASSRHGAVVMARRLGLIP
ncbi:LuxR C-terminal-related transcriptional regulator [Mycobacterium sp. CPCC 205372]|uniref:LuxR C-terminal-related transcriptional regulator n=1 Tax=Mycobacterium hippophais TaxID=3016340 RepID=A0ABT4PQQ4_9MYCO|nr:LuxR C-terminal-related transcriptional regulator [Mycobacterium hippophais]MCZ8378899.1 LuxR C-terminal-related transcriptional regulator [Mycobacterium hippophais]